MEKKEEGTGRILIAGDLFPTEQNVAFFEQGDVDSLFGPEICRIFAGADLALCNLEGALSDHPGVCRKTGPVKVAPSRAIAAYKRLGIQVCMLANNHVTDGGAQGVLDTMQTLDQAGIRYYGAGKNASAVTRAFVQPVAGLRVGFYNVAETMYNRPGKDTPGAWLYDEWLVCREMEALKQQCDYLVVVYHGGVEKYPYPSPETRKRFRRMAESGADLVVAQHTHCIGTQEVHQGACLMYGQGDFLLKNYLPGKTDTGLVLELRISDGKVELVRHLVRSVENRFVRYDQSQDLSAWDALSLRLDDEAFLDAEFRKFCDRELSLYLKAFKSPSIWARLLRRVSPRAYKAWLRGRAWHGDDLLFALHTLRSEQNRETAVTGLETLLEDANRLSK